MTDYRLPMHQMPSRKPLPSVHSGPQFGHHGYQQQQYQPHPQAQHPSVASLAHSRNRTTSSNVLPYAGHDRHHPQQPASPQHSMTVPYNPLARRLSSATTSTTSTGNNADIRRSTSSRSAGSQMSYVALLRRQKATVWCDRAQAEDPRLRQQKLVDKKRAYLEVHGAGAGRASTLGSGKGKHGNKVTDLSPSALVGATVPVRLSANEVGDAEDDARSERDFPYRRTGSGRSSLGSGHRYPSGYQRNTTSSSNTPPNERTDLPGVSEDKAEELQQSAAKDDATTEATEQEDTLGEMGAPSAATLAEQKAKKAADLRRRGSVDDRTTSMTNVRLFVANPDLSD
ncbi:uncharacterized protein DSM5745_00467 [Aspergillus mulundensis]|uniref:Uncharacterized protein n=1 Tax=Aspergillus mulundensis TaxID=1810919 RepID=A0A3D8T3K8_9EURO|nr:Uncharacterized protein DSM5745_00467 [Aspergillus mulundensis]RDW93145.1 Uncharacterized protein DSM5745_00467 [Aspergillus mulundensis]